MYRHDIFLISLNTTAKSSSLRVILVSVLTAQYPDKSLPCAFRCISVEGF